MADDLVILAQFVKLGRLRKKYSWNWHKKKFLKYVN